MASPCRSGRFHPAVTYPELIHTVAVFSGAPRFPSLHRGIRSSRPRFYFTAGIEEPEVLKNTQQLVQALKDRGCDVELYIARGRGHSIPTRGVSKVLELFQQMTQRLP